MSQRLSSQKLWPAPASLLWCPIPPAPTKGMMFPSPLTSLPVWKKEIGLLLSCPLLFGVVFLEEADSSVNSPLKSQPYPMAPALTVLQETLLWFTRGYPWEPPSLLMPSLPSFHSSENSLCHMLKPPELSELDPGWEMYRDPSCSSCRKHQRAAIAHCCYLLLRKDRESL